jgi:hypothetical protein
MEDLHIETSIPILEGVPTLIIQTNLKQRICSGEITIGAIAPVTVTKSRIEDIMGVSKRR